MNDGLRQFLIAAHGENPDISDRLLELTYPKEIAAFEAGKEIADKENEDIATIAYLQGAGRAKWHYTKNVDFPTEQGRYLTWRDLHGEQYPQILAFDGKYWVTGNDHPDCIVVAWKEIEPPEERV